MSDPASVTSREARRSGRGSVTPGGRWVGGGREPGVGGVPEGVTAVPVPVDRWWTARDGTGRRSGVLARGPPPAHRHLGQLLRSCPHRLGQRAARAARCPHQAQTTTILEDEGEKRARRKEPGQGLTDGRPTRRVSPASLLRKKRRSIAWPVSAGPGSARASSWAADHSICHFGLDGFCRWSSPAAAARSANGPCCRAMGPRTRVRQQMALRGG
jgi:hypothetical protein